MAYKHKIPAPNKNIHSSLGEKRKKKPGSHVTGNIIRKIKDWRLTLMTPFIYIQTVLIIQNANRAGISVSACVFVCVHAVIAHADLLRGDDEGGGCSVAAVI